MAMNLPHIFVVGCGPGAPEHLTDSARRAGAEAEALGGSRRVLDLFADGGRQERTAVEGDVADKAVFETKITGLVFDLSALEYISSAGLRVFFIAKKKTTSLGATMKVIGANESVRGIFQIIGFALDD